MKRTLALVALSVLGATFLLTPTSAGPPTTDVAELRSQVAALTQQVGALNQRVAKLERMLKLAGPLSNEGALKEIVDLTAANAVTLKTFTIAPQVVQVDLEFPGSSLRDVARFRSQLKAALLRPGGFSKLECDSVRFSGPAGAEVMSTTIRLRR
jgi:hypothetical protein